MSDEPEELIGSFEPPPEMQRAVEFVRQVQAEYERLFTLADPAAIMARRDVSTGQQILEQIAATHQSPFHGYCDAARNVFLKWREGDDYRPDSLTVK